MIYPVDSVIHLSNDPSLGKKVSLHISHKKNCCDMNLGEGVCIFIFFLFSDSGLYLLNGFDYYFDLLWMAWHWKAAINKSVFIVSQDAKHIWLYVEYPPSGGQTVGVIVGGLALVAMTLVGIGFHRKRKRKRKLSALLAKRYGSTFHFFQHLTLKHCPELRKKFLGSQETGFFYVD